MGWVGSLLAGLFMIGAARTASGQVTQLQIAGLKPVYSAPYLLDFTFSLRDQNNHAIILPPSGLQVVCREDGTAIGSETGYRLVTGDNKQLQCFLVLDYTYSMADPFANGDVDGDGYSDALETMEASAKALVGTLHADAQVGIYEFHREDPAHPPQRVSPLTSDKADLTNRIDRIWPDVVLGFPASTRCWDAVYDALGEFPDANPRDDQRFVVFLSDGRDESSTTTPAQIVSRAVSKGVRIHCVGYGRELSPQNLDVIARQTGGRYYPATSPAQMSDQFAQIVRDLGGQYVLRWATLKRGATAFVPSFDVKLAGRTASATGGGYRSASYEGDVLEGRLFFGVSTNADSSCLLSLNAQYIPRGITRIRVNFATAKPFTAQVVPFDEGGVAPTNWTATIRHTNGVGVAEFSSPTPANPFTALPFATLGKLLRFRLQSVTDVASCFYEFAVDNTAYQATGQSLKIENLGEVLSPLSALPRGTPISWLGRYGITTGLLLAEDADPDGDGIPTWQEYVTGTDPTNRLSAHRLTDVETSEGCRVTFNTDADRSYRLEYGERLGSWLPLRTNIAGTGARVTVHDPADVGLRPGRFYRLVMESAKTPILAWGGNEAGQLHPPAGLDDVVSIGAGYRYGVALRADGRVAAWGFNESGETNVPAGLSGVLELATGYSHSLVLLPGGKVRGWGASSLGQITIPYGLPPVRHVVPGEYHSLVLLTDGTVYGWGNAAWGQLHIPFGLDHVVQLASGNFHGLALRSDGAVVGWGAGGDAAFGQATIPTGLQNNVVQLAGGYFHSLAVLRDGTVRAWGKNTDGQCNVPAGLRNVVKVVTRFHHNLALRSDGTVVAWGKNTQRQCDVPAGLSKVIDIAAGENHSMVLVRR